MSPASTPTGSGRPCSRTRCRRAGSGADRRARCAFASLRRSGRCCEGSREHSGAPRRRRRPGPAAALPAGVRGPGARGEYRGLTAGSSTPVENGRSDGRGDGRPRALRRRSRAWLRALNDVRLVLGTRLDVTEDLDWKPRPERSSNPRTGDLRLRHLDAGAAGRASTLRRRRCRSAHLSPEPPAPYPRLPSPTPPPSTPPATSRARLRLDVCAAARQRASRTRRATAAGTAPASMNSRASERSTPPVTSSCTRGAARAARGRSRAPRGCPERA